METVKVTTELPALPEGWEYTGEFRVPLKGEAGADLSEQCQFIVRKVKWKPAIGERFYYVTPVTGISWDIARQAYLGEDLASSGNCFKTREEAEVAASKFKKILAGE